MINSAAAPANEDAAIDCRRSPRPDVGCGNDRDPHALDRQRALAPVDRLDVGVGVLRADEAGVGLARHRGVKVFVSPDILEDEQRAIFDKSWIYVGHASEIKNPGDFKTRAVAGRPVIFCRDRAGNVRALLNVCRHRGAIVCREREGNARQFYCIYHGWFYNTDGLRSRASPGDEAYPPGFDKQGKGLVPVPRLEHYKDFYFANLDPDAVDLHTYLAGAKDYIDLVVDQSPSGRMEIISGVQEYDIKANWKLLVENSVDDYHLVTTHSTWLNYMRNSGVNVTPAKGHMLPTKGFGKDLGNGHLTTDNPNYRAARWRAGFSVFGEEPRPTSTRSARSWVDRLGEARRRARRRYQPQPPRIFPNLVINDGSSVTVRNFTPVAPDLMHRHRLGARPGRGDRAAARPPPARVPHLLRPRRLCHADDVAALELAQKGYAAWREVPWTDLSRGMGSSQEQLATDEGHLRVFWRKWNEVDGAAGMNKPVDPAATVTRAEVEDFLYHEADLLDDWQLDDWLGLLTDTAEYYGPAQRQAGRRSDRFTLFTVADDIVRLRERIIPAEGPELPCRAYPPAHAAADHRTSASHRDRGRTDPRLPRISPFPPPPQRAGAAFQFVGRYRHKLKRTDAGLRSPRKPGHPWMRKNWGRWGR